MVLWARHSDAKLERRWHFAAPALIGALALGLTTVISGNFWVSMLLLTVATAGSRCAATGLLGNLHRLPVTNSRAAGIAIITSIGNLSGFVSPYVIGSIKTSTGSTTIGIYLMTAVVVAGVLSLLVGVPPRMVHEREEN